ncbi:hypothetical protein [Aureimonas ureilytica]|uniref:hypothetical protein n=1 Tax=Aureimonas ureilytica TaxID=401562 RepID=UPI000A71ECF7|nr:hypothetical protein [Aureimonas ureilytica]
MTLDTFGSLRSKPIRRTSNRTAYGVAIYSMAMLAMLYFYYHYALLTAIGHWEGDEFATSLEYMQGGWPALLARITNWSPRPFSESLLFAYFRAVELSGRQLIAPFLYVVWAIFLIPLALLLYQIKHDNPQRTPFAFICALSTPLLFLTHPYAYDVFFWVQGAAAYLPTLFAILLVLITLSFVDTLTTFTRTLLISALVVAAFSSELGAFFVVIFSGLIIAQSILAPILRRFLPVAEFKISHMTSPFVAGCSVIFGMYAHRFGDKNEIFGNKNIAQHFYASILSTLQTFPLEFTGARPVSSFLELIVYGPLAKIFFAIGIAIGAAALGITVSRSRGVALLAFAAAALGAAFLSTFASFYQFGENCCGRHQVMREGYDTMALFAVAIVASSLLIRAAAFRSKILECLGLIFVVSAVLVASVPNWPNVKRSYERFAKIRATMASNWQAGRLDSPRLVYFLRGDSYSGDPSLHPGIYARSDVNLVTGRMLDYFHKSEIEIVPPLQ